MKSGVLVTLMAVSMAGAGCTGAPFLEGLSEKGLKGSGKPVTQSFDVKEVRGFKAGGSFEVTITPDSAPLTVTCDDNLLPHLVHKIEDGILSLGFDRGVSSRLPLKASVGIKALERLDLSGACSLKAESVDLSALTADLSGASKAEISGRVQKADLTLTGSSFLVLDSSPEETRFDVSGASKLEIDGKGVMQKLSGDVSGASCVRVAPQIEEAELKLSGASSAEIDAKKLIGSASGASQMKLRSKPVEESFEVSGAASRSLAD